MTDYPVNELDPVRRLRVLAATVPGAAYGEATLDAPHAQVWAFVADMDTAMPLLFPNFRSWRTVERDSAGDGERLQAAAVGYLGLRSLFEVTLKPGLCIMQDRRFVGGLAARPDAAGTRFALIAAPRGPGRHLGPLLRPLGRRLLRRSSDRLATRLGAG